MDKSDWKKIEDALSGTFGCVLLDVDGFEIDLHRGMVAKNRLGIHVYVNGWIRGEWLTSDCPESKFMRPCKTYIYSRKNREFFKKLNRKSKRLGIKDSTINKFDPDQIYEYRQSYWHSVDGIRRYYEKTFANIKLKKINGEEYGCYR